MLGCSIYHVHWVPHTSGSKHITSRGAVNTRGAEAAGTVRSLMSHDGTTSQQSGECHERDGELDRAQLSFLPGLHHLERPAPVGERVDRDERQRRDEREGTALEQHHRPEGPHADRDVDELARELDRAPAPLRSPSATPIMAKT
jgi:hypothetical protein